MSSDKDTNAANGINGSSGMDFQTPGSTRRLIMLGLSLGLLLASLDQTVVGTSLPKIVGQIGGLSKFSWLFSAYMLTSTVMIPLAGKMSDRYGRKPIFLFGMAFFMAGSALGGFAQNMDQLILFRAIQGFGGGSMMPVVMATVADLYPPTERGKIQGSLGAIFALSSIIGPFIGGYIVDNMDWRWVFFVNLPVGVVAIAVTSAKFPKIGTNSKSPIDYAGISMLSAALTSGLLITFWGGTTYSWDSLEIIGLGVACAVFSVMFVVMETRAKDPMIPLGLFKDSIFSLGSLAMMIMAFGLFGVIAFLPMFLQAVVGISATYSGEVLIPLMLTSMLGSIVSGVLLKRTGYKVWLLAGPPIAAAGLWMLSTLNSDSSAMDAVFFLLVGGLGLGFTMANYIVAAQNVVDKKLMGTMTSSMALFRSIGGTIGITVLGAVVNRRMVSELATNLPPDASNYLPTTDINTLGGILLVPNSSLPEPVIEGIRVSLSNSITSVFLISAFIVLAAWVVTIFIKSVPLKSKEDYMNGTTPPGGDETSTSK